MHTHFTSDPISMMICRCERGKMAPTLWLIAMTLAVGVLGGELGQRPLKTAREVGFTGRWGELPEAQRLKKRTEAGWTWTFPGESPEYREWQERRTAEIKDLYHFQERLDNWVQYTQVRSVINFTKLGFDVVDAPPELHARMKERLHTALSQGLRKEMGGKPQGIFGDEWPEFVNHGEPRLLQQLQGLHEEWAPEAGPLNPITAYGMRVYRRGASLAWHTDRVDTHVISSIFHVDHHYDDEARKPWPIEIEGHDGKRHQVSLKPGQMLLYESAKCPHGRSTALEGDFYASIFSHFQPKPDKWPYTQQDVWLAVPPDWDSAPITHSGSGRWAGAFLTHDSMEVLGMDPRDPRDLHASTKLRGEGSKPPYEDHRALGHYDAQRPFAKLLKDQLDGVLKLKQEEEAGSNDGGGDDAADAAATAPALTGAQKRNKEEISTSLKQELGLGQVKKGPTAGGGGSGGGGLQTFKAHEAKKQVVMEHADKMKKLGMSADEAARALKLAEGQGDDVVATVRKLAASEAADKANSLQKKKKTKKKGGKGGSGGNAGEGDGEEEGEKEEETLGEEVLEAAEAALEVTGAGLSVVAVLLFFASGGTLVGCGLLLRRMLVTKGRSLTRPTHLKKDAP